MRKIIIITGYPAAGKTAFSQRLKEALGIPCFNKDSVKVLLAENIGFADRQENKVLSNTAVKLMFHIAGEILQAGQPVIVEGNFSQAEGDALAVLLAQWGAEAMTYIFTGDLPVIYQRYVQRDQSAERHAAHKSAGFAGVEEFAAAVMPLAGFSVPGEVVRVDSTDFAGVDFEGLAARGRGFLLMEKA